MPNSGRSTSYFKNIYKGIWVSKGNSSSFAHNKEELLAPKQSMAWVVMHCWYSTTNYFTTATDFKSHNNLIPKTYYWINFINISHNLRISSLIFHNGLINCILTQLIVSFIFLLLLTFCKDIIKLYKQ